MAVLNSVGNALTGVTGTGNFVGANTPTFVTGTVTVPSVTFSSTSGIIGTTTNDNAAALSVGQEITSVIPLASAVSLTTATPANLTTLSLTAGDWDVYGNITATLSAGTDFTQFMVWISLFNASVPDHSLMNKTTTLGASILGLSAPYFRVSASGTTTVYLSCNQVFAGGTMTACGGFYARRRR